MPLNVHISFPSILQQKDEMCQGEKTGVGLNKLWSIILTVTSAVAATLLLTMLPCAHTQAASGPSAFPHSQDRQERPQRHLLKNPPTAHSKAGPRPKLEDSWIKRLLSSATRAFKAPQQRPPVIRKNQADFAHQPLFANDIEIEHWEHSMADQLSDEAQSQCRSNVLVVFPDIDPDHLATICEQYRWLQQDIIEQILDDQDDGRPYPKAPRPSLKRKRGDDEHDPETLENLAKKFNNEEHRAKPKSQNYWDQRSVFYHCHCITSKRLWLAPCPSSRSPTLSSVLMLFSYQLLQKAFPRVYMDDLRKIWVHSGSCLYPTYLAIDKALAEWDPNKSPFNLKSRPRATQPLSLDEIDQQIQSSASAEQREIFEEYRAARAFQLKKQGDAEKKERERKLEEDNFEKARAEGNVVECGCCFVEYALNRMVHCDGESVHVSQLSHAPRLFAYDFVPSLVVLPGLRTELGGIANRPRQTRTAVYVCRWLRWRVLHESARDLSRRSCEDCSRPDRAGSCPPGGRH